MTAIPLSYDDNGHSGSRPFVFVHGWTCDRSFFQPQYDYFGRYERSVALDLRGHGESPPAADGDYSIDAFAGDVAGLIDDLNLAPAVVVGHSLGGVIACATAAAYPDRVAAVVMVDPAPFVMPDALLPVFQRVLERLNGDNAEGARAELIEGMFMASDDAERKAMISKAMSVVPLSIAVPAISGLFAFDGRAALAKVQCPIASVGSDGPVNDALEMKRINPKLLVGQTLAAGHFNQLEVPEQVNAMIEQFVRVSL
jgi:pimeloyl-ACP methyl ester carboxylesterase